MSWLDDVSLSCTPLGVDAAPCASSFFGKISEGVMTTERHGRFKRLRVLRTPCGYSVSFSRVFMGQEMVTRVRILAWGKSELKILPRGWVNNSCPLRHCFCGLRYELAQANKCR